MNPIVNHKAQEANRALSRRCHHQHDERGYALLALMAAMAVLVILLSAAAPVLKHEAQRERELEAIRRGEQVAQAVRAYITLTNGKLPTSMDELLEGAQRAGRTKKTQVLRRSSMRDPLSPDGEWRTIKQLDPALKRFCNDVQRYAETTGLTPVPGTPPVLIQIQTTVCLPININVAEPDEPEEPLGDAPSSGPFIGVASQSGNTSIVNYYGIDKHRHWVFTPLFR